MNNMINYKGVINIINDMKQYVRENFVTRDEYNELLSKFDSINNNIDETNDTQNNIEKAIDNRWIYDVNLGKYIKME